MRALQPTAKSRSMSRSQKECPLARDSKNISAGDRALLSRVDDGSFAPQISRQEED